MKDNVWIKCPECGANVAMSYVNADGFGMDYNMETAPMELKLRMHNDTFFCKKCQTGKKITLQITFSMV